MVTLRCPRPCNYGIMVDEGPTVRLRLVDWRRSKTTGRLTASCPKCQRVYDMNALTDTQGLTFIAPLTTIFAENQ